MQYDSRPKPEWLKNGDLKRLKKADIPSNWTMESMREFIQSDDIALLKATNIIAGILSNIDDTVNSRELRTSFENSLPGALRMFIVDVNKSWKDRGKISVAQLKALRKIFRINECLITYMLYHTITKRKEKDGNTTSS